MADDRRPKHRDYARPPSISSGIPPEIDPELTPLPAAPPGPEAFSVLPIGAKVDALHHVVQEQSAAIERVWEARHVADRLERLEDAQAKLADNVAQDTQQVTGLIVQVQQLRDIARDAFEKSMALSDKQIALDTQLGIFFNKQFPEYLEEVKTSNALLRSVQMRVADVEHRIEVAETKQAAHDARIVSLERRADARDDADRDKQVASTAVATERRRWFSFFKLGHAAAVAIGGGIAWFVHWLKS